MKANFINYFLTVILILGLFFYFSCSHVPEQTSTPPAPVQSETSAVVSPSYATEPLFSSLENQLIADGVDAHLVKSTYQNPDVKLEPHIIAGNLKRSEKALHYS